jgi:hypothetical protein
MVQSCLNLSIFGFPLELRRSFLRFLDHAQRRTTLGTTPLDERSARSKDLYLTSNNTQQTNINVPSDIRTQSRSELAAAEVPLRPRGHWDRPI